MAFGKRVSPPASRDKAAVATPATATKVRCTSSLFIERATRLKEHLDRVLVQATAIITAIRQGVSIDAQGFDIGLEPESFPIDIGGFAHHFNFERDGRLKHSVYVYSRADGVLDRTAQLHLLDLTSAIMRLNTMYALAHKDDALAVALHAKASRGDIDRVVVLAGFLSAMLGNMIDMAYATQNGGRTPSSDQMYRKLDACGHAAHRAMLDPEMFDALAPKFDWPLMLVEAEEDDQAGQLFVNQVYLPADIAGQMRQMLVREQANAMAGRAAA